MKFTDADIQKILLQGNYISEQDVTRAREYIRTHRTNFLEYLYSEELLNKDLLGQAIAEYLHVPYADLNSQQPSKEQIALIPEQVAKKFRVVVFLIKKGAVLVTTDDPTQTGIEDALQKIFTQSKIFLAYSLSEDIDTAFIQYQTSLEARFAFIIKNSEHIAPDLLDAIFADAVDGRASDIHFESIKDKVLIRFRIDGVLREMGHIEKEQYENILNRIKVQSGIRIDEHFATQDGSMQYKKDSIAIDMRTSVVPTIEGEKIVLRILNSYIQGFGLNELGLSSDHQKILEKSALKPFGMILTVGPTGSGKTTTLYALLKMLNQSDVNITTIEDPVEYRVAGVNQIQVNQITNVTFAKGLRSIVRQDPDIILVGEIRDRETAEIAVNAALTGHLLLSTFHANDAATAVPRLLDMGIEPFLLASTLELVVAQRLARKICDQCRSSFEYTYEDIVAIRPELKHFFEKKKYTLYKGNGCTYCGNTGYHGRIAFCELIVMTPELQNLILRHPSAQEIWQMAHAQGAKSLFEDGLEKVKNGVTTVDELLRVAEPPHVVNV